MNQIQTRYAKVTEEVDVVVAAQSIALAHLNPGTDEYVAAAQEWRSSQGIDFVPMSEAIASDMMPSTAAEVWRPSVDTAQSLAAAAMALEDVAA